MLERTAVLKRYAKRQSRLLLQLVAIPLACAALAAAVLLYFLGGTDLLRHAGSQLLTWTGMRHALMVVFGLSFVTWIRHDVWYSHEPPPMWFRRSIWLNLLELSILIGLVLLAIWAVPRFA